MTGLSLVLLILSVPRHLNVCLRRLSRTFVSIPPQWTALLCSVLAAMPLTPPTNIMLVLTLPRPLTSVLRFVGWKSSALLLRWKGAPLGPMVTALAEGPRIENETLQWTLKCPLQMGIPVVSSLRNFLTRLGEIAKRTPVMLPVVVQIVFLIRRLLIVPCVFLGQVRKAMSFPGPWLQLSFLPMTVSMTAWLLVLVGSRVPSLG